ncbi:MAG: glucose-6-phosphate dehydrogenase [Candidatus Pacebacteria bacterium]|nr:glucose-6-phosphate dehydrogenase [Candidatus Paceibacterota bacterium]
MPSSEFTADLTETLCVESTPSPCGLVIFGASGDLTSRKLMPSLFRLFQRNLLPDNFFVLGFARSPLGTHGFRERIRKDLSEQSAATPQTVENFCEQTYYLPGSYDDPALYQELKKWLRDLDTRHDTQGNVVFYLSTPPRVYGAVAENLAEAGLLQQGGQKTSWRRLVAEKPFGHDLDSARQLNASIAKCLAEEQIYRIDHYLGKETVQNILMLRFANAIFEPLWNRHYIDHVQITAAETIGVGLRAGYYDTSGALRDMFQNHMLQLLALVGMEPPSSFEANHVRDEKRKLLQCIRPFCPQDVEQHVVRGQYLAGEVEDQQVRAYRDEDKIGQDSETETFVAARFMLDNWRWRGVPFYLRSGKRLNERRTDISIAFKPVPHSIFNPLLPEHLAVNILTLNVQPLEGIALRLQAKRPGPKLCMSTLDMAFSYHDVFGDHPPDAYERLLLDVMLGDQTLFIRRDNSETQWSILMPILDYWQKAGSARENAGLTFYPAGSWGPQAAQELIQKDNRMWLNSND